MTKVLSEFIPNIFLKGDIISLAAVTLVNRDSFFIDLKSKNTDLQAHVCGFTRKGI